MGDSVRVTLDDDGASLRESMRSVLLEQPDAKEWRHTQPPAAEEGMQRIRPPLCCGGIADDCKRRSRHCLTDYLDGIRHWQKTLAASVFMFFATFFSTVALGALVQKTTGGRIALFEYLLMNSCAGVVHSIVGSQPLLVLRPTGPITAIMQKLSDLADQLELDFYLYFAATGACVGLLMAVVASLEVTLAYSTTH